MCCELMFAYFGLFFCCIIFIIFTERFRNLTLYFTLIFALIFPFIADTSRWNWFYFVKTYSVIFPIIVLSIAQSKFYYQLDWLERFHPFIPNIARLFLALNIVEGGVLLASFGHYSTGILCLILIFTMPKFTFTEKQNLGFDNVLWIIGYSYCFLIGLIFYPQDTNFIFPILTALIIPLIFCLTLKDWNVWLTFRVYSIYFILILDVIFSSDQFLVFDIVNNSMFISENRINAFPKEILEVFSLLIGSFVIFKFTQSQQLMKNHSSVAYNGG